LVIKAVSTRIAGILLDIRTRQTSSLCPLFGIPSLLDIDLATFADNCLVFESAAGLV
jgi:hypothetical protein